MPEETEQPANELARQAEKPGEEQPKRRFRLPNLPELPDLPLLGRLKSVDEPADEPGAGDGAEQAKPEGRGRPRFPDLPDLPDVKELATHLSQLFPAPSPYLMEPWEVSLASLVDKVPHVPDIAVKALGLLDGFGAVHIGPQKLGFDGEEVEWDKVVALRTRRVSDMISGSVLEYEVDRLRHYLPPVPGRKWAVGKAVDLLVVLSMVALEDQLEVVLGLVDGARGFDAAADQVTRDGRVVAEIVYKGWVRKEKELQAGVLASAVLAQVHGADHCLREMAAARGIPVVQTEDGNDLEDATEKAAAIRRRIEELRARIPMLRRDPDPDPEQPPATGAAGPIAPAGAPPGAYAGPPGRPGPGAPAGPRWGPGGPGGPVLRPGAPAAPAGPGWGGPGGPGGPVPPPGGPVAPGWPSGPNGPGAPPVQAPTAGSAAWPGGPNPPDAPSAGARPATSPWPGDPRGPQSPGASTAPARPGDQTGTPPPAGSAAWLGGPKPPDAPSAGARPATSPWPGDPRGPQSPGASTAPARPRDQAGPPPPAGPGVPGWPGAPGASAAPPPPARPGVDPSIASGSPADFTEEPT